MPEIKCIKCGEYHSGAEAVCRTCKIHDISKASLTTDTTPIHANHVNEQPRESHGRFASEFKTQKKGNEKLGLILIGVALVAISIVGISKFLYPDQSHSDSMKIAEENLARDTEHAKTLFIEKAKMLVLGRLKDPDSARFAGIYVYTGKADTENVCGYVNSKNGFGGYGGNKGFISSGYSVVFEEDYPSSFNDMWGKACQGK